MTGPMLGAGGTNRPASDGTGRRAVSFAAAAGLGAQAVTIGGGLVAQVIVARHLGTADFGVYSIATTLTYLFAVVLRFGLHGLAVRSVAQAAASGPGTEGAVARHLAVLSGRIALVGLPLLGLAVIPLADSLLLSGRLDGETIWVLSATISLEAVRFVCSECFRGLHRQGMAAAFGNAGRTLAFVALVAAVVLVGDESGLDVVLMVALVASAVSAVVAATALRRVLRRTTPAGVVAEPTARGTLRQGSPFLAAELCAFTIALGDVLVVGYFASDVDVALYAAASRAASMLAIPATILVGLLSPLIASMWARGERVALQRLLSRMVTISGGVGLVGLLGVVLLGGWVLSTLFGPDFAAGSTVLTVLALGATANVFFGQGFQLLILCGRARTATSIMVTFSAMTIAAEIVAAARWGILGVAAASAAGVALQQFCLTIIAKRTIGIGAYPFAGVRNRYLGEVS
ncbi:lipopolysaccharide biosynthesis protein [Pseudonocardia alni]|uniref:lipopolysaccharide biosynthesis protein n=1 Tax=Pseudonocardia alni TaxID=33907 RepID=UPI0033ED2CCD